MKSLSIIATVIVFLAAAGRAQADTAKLVHEGDKTDCETNLEYVDNLFVELNGDLSSHGYIVLSAPAEKFSSLIDLDVQLDSALTRRHYDTARVSIVIQEKPGKVHYQFWAVPAGATLPFGKVSEASEYSIPRGTKPFILHEDPEEVCSTEGFSRVLSKVLASNSSARGETVIYASSEGVRRKRLREAKLTLAGIPSSRLHFVFRSTSRDSARTEYWLVPSSI